MEKPYSGDVGMTREIPQYSPARILGLWALVTAPMGVLAWFIGPLIMPFVSLHPGLVHWLLISVGLIWQGTVSVIVLNHELGGLRWSDVRERLWLSAPRDPVTGQSRRRLWLWVLPCLAGSALANLLIGGSLDDLWVGILPWLRAPAYTEIAALADPQFRGQWWILGLALVSALFNYLLGEELFFHGVLLPQMRGAFGRWDWVVNAVLFGLYHVHKPWAWPSIILGNLAIVWPARRFRSNWMAVIVHGVEGFFLVLVFAVIVGWYP